MKALESFADGARVFCLDVAHGCADIAHNGLAVLGLLGAVGVSALALQPELRRSSEAALLTFLQDRQAQILGFVAEPDAVERATAANPKELPKQQANLAFWISKKYRVAPEPISALVAEAYEVGVKTKLDPTLILAIMAIESGYNPFAQSPVGAQGLMQVMTRVHSDKYEGFGGSHAAFDPITNLRVGVKVLQECVARAGSIEGGLRLYVGATSDATEGGYTLKVLAEQARLKRVAEGEDVPLFSPAPPVAMPPVTLPAVDLTSTPAPVAPDSGPTDKLVSL